LDFVIWISLVISHWSFVIPPELTALNEQPGRRLCVEFVESFSCRLAVEVVETWRVFWSAHKNVAMKKSKSNHQSPATHNKSTYSLRKGLGVWELTFKGRHKHLRRPHLIVSTSHVSRSFRHCTSIASRSAINKETGSCGEDRGHGCPRQI